VATKCYPDEHRGGNDLNKISTNDIKFTSSKVSFSVKIKNNGTVKLTCVFASSYSVMNSLGRMQEYIHAL
jgi:spore coat protein U-like protein